MNCSLILVCLFVIFGEPIGVHSLVLTRTCSETLQDCVAISSCKTLNYNFTLLSKKDQEYYVERMWCTGDLNATDPMVCCSKYVAGNGLLDGQYYSDVVSSGKILGGNDAQIEEFPWLALLEYENKNTSKHEYLCAGSLISNQYVLTAAHCISDELKRVHLGKYDLKKHDNCDKNKVCAHPTVIIDIEEKIKHEQYDEERSLNDIALIRLSKKVHFTDFIKPICLPSTLASKNTDSYSIAGWGGGAGNSTVKQKLGIPIVELAYCTEQYINYSVKKAIVPVSGIHICAGEEKHAGACIGDSGGSLSSVISDGERLRYVLEGIISAGYNFCGNIDKNRYPMLFTNVSTFDSWIKEKTNKTESTTTHGRK